MLTLEVSSLVPRHAQLVSLAVTKSGAGGRPGRSRHVIRAAIDVTASLLELITQGVRPPYVPIQVPVLTAMGRTYNGIKFSNLSCCIMAKFYAKRSLLYNGKILCQRCLAVTQGKLLC